MSDAGLVYGLHAVRALIERAPARIDTLYVSHARQDARVTKLVRLARERGVRIDEVAGEALDSLAAGVSHQGAIARTRPGARMGEGALDDVLDAAGPTPLVLVLDGVQDPRNLGACLRTADAAGVVAVVAPRDRAAGLTGTVRKVAAGAAESIPLIQVVNLTRTLRWLKERGLWVVGTDADAPITIHDADLRGPLAIVMGAEAVGLRRLTREQCDVLVRIPMRGSVASLNVSVATGVVLFEATRQRL
jgi:23S rRNA (guanosine2251-2'-O)-methyltransferase